MPVVPCLSFHTVAASRCLVELVAALQHSKAVVMLVGRALDDGRFKTNHAMLQSLFRLVDVRHAKATVPEDLEREMATIQATVGVDRVNTLARGALEGAMQAGGGSRPCVCQPAVRRVSR